MNFPGSFPSGGGIGPSGVDANDPNVKMIQRAMESCFVKSAMSGVAGFGLGGLFGMFMASMAYDTPYSAGAPPPPPAAAATASKAAAAATAGSAAPSGTAAAVNSLKTAAASAAKATATATAATPAAATAGAAAGAAASAGAASAARAAAPSLGPTAAITPETIASLPLRQQLAVGFKDMGARSWSTAKNFGTVGALFSGIECGVEGLRAKNDLGNGVAAGCLTGAILARNAGPQAAGVGCVGFAAFSAAIDAWLRMPPKDE